MGSGHTELYGGKRARGRTETEGGGRSSNVEGRSSNVADRIKESGRRKLGVERFGYPQLGKPDTKTVDLKAIQRQSASGFPHQPSGSPNQTFIPTTMPTSEVHLPTRPFQPHQTPSFDYPSCPMQQLKSADYFDAQPQYQYSQLPTQPQSQYQS